MQIEIPPCSSLEGTNSTPSTLKLTHRAQEARRQAVRMPAEQRGATTDVERECLGAIYAYEWTLFKKHGNRQRAAYTWRMVDERGIIPAVEHAVTRPKETAGYCGLQAEGMLGMAFEAVVLRHK